MKRYIKSAIADLSTEDLDIRLELARDFNTSPTVLEQLVYDPFAGVRIQVANNPNTPESALKLLAADRNFDVRETVAKREDLSVDILAALVNFSDITILDKVARNKNVTDEILMDMLSRDTKDNDVAYVVSRTEMASSEVLRHIFDTCSEDPCILHRLAKNPNTPEDIIITLADNPDSWVYVPAKKRLGMPII